MSRRSHWFADGQAKFSWTVERIAAPSDSGGERFKATCRNNPSIFAFGDSEQHALRAAQATMQQAIIRDQTPIATPGLSKAAVPATTPAPDSTPEIDLGTPIDVEL